MPRARKQPENCPDCDHALEGRHCINADCETGQQNISADAGRVTAKASTSAARQQERRPRAFSRSGGFD